MYNVLLLKYLLREMGNLLCRASIKNAFSTLNCLSNSRKYFMQRCLSYSHHCCISIRVATIANAPPPPRSESDYLVAGAYQEARSVEAIVFVKRFLPLALLIDGGA